MKSRRVYEHFVGTPNFMAPECIRNIDSSFASDVWSLGASFYQIISGFPPFQGKSEYLIFKEVVEGNFCFGEELFDEDSEDLIRFIMKLDPKERPSLEEIKKHAFFKDCDWQTRKPFASCEVTKEEAELLAIKKKIVESCQVAQKPEKENLEALQQNFEGVWKETLQAVLGTVSTSRRLEVMKRQAMAFLGLQEFQQVNTQSASCPQ